MKQHKVLQLAYESQANRTASVTSGIDNSIAHSESLTYRKSLLFGLLMVVEKNCLSRWTTFSYKYSVWIKNLTVTEVKCAGNSTQFKYR